MHRRAPCPTIKASSFVRYAHAPVSPLPDDPEALEADAYSAFDKGDLQRAARAFDALLGIEPESADFHYMQGLTQKYLRNWARSLHHNQRALSLGSEPNDAATWNAGIAATALRHWREARRHWRNAGIDVADCDEPINHHYGNVSIRLNPDSCAETVFAERIDVVRARLLNVPLPESGHRFGDIVLHDGARTGERQWGDSRVPVFNALSRLHVSEYRTFVVFVRAATLRDVDALLHAIAPGIGMVEDWTTSIRHYCMRCSYGTPHTHESSGASPWQPERNLGIAAVDLASVEDLLKQWIHGSPDRHFDGLANRDCELPEPTAATPWWRGPDDGEIETA
ncbi:tetratricopeptide repeat protein [Tahibacter amnicola]|uniref:Tetratricopeptide repeat protein n=1 Tax=Tahibacter amnicola TaxID=2976241 RepID=A0ABY6BNW6_9GAMM|nr:hypothetical protein [Tahibacter amnicola]UXI70090.1 hypothetical protein N4264_10815 [Tahibacter amnicola]